MKLTDIFVPPMAYVHYFLSKPIVDENTFREQLKILLANARSQANAKSSASTHSDHAFFAVIAWIDESVMCSSWEGAAAWSRYPLQREYFHTTRAGTEFFNRLQNLSNDDEGNAVREVFCLCLSMGFKGRYIQDSVQLKEIRALEIKALLGDGALLTKDTIIFPALRVAQKPDALIRCFRWRLTRPQLLLVSVPCCLFGLLYLIFEFVLASQADGFLRFVK